MEAEPARMPRFKFDALLAEVRDDDERVYKRAEAYHRRGAAKLYSIGATSIEGVVSGRYDYMVRVNWGHGDGWRPECNCYAAMYQDICKHAIALVMLARDRSDLGLAANLAAPPVRRDTPKPSKAPSRPFTKWQERIRAGLTNQVVERSTKRCDLVAGIDLLRSAESEHPMLRSGRVDGEEVEWGLVDEETVSKSWPISDLVSYTLLTDLIHEGRAVVGYEDAAGGYFRISGDRAAEQLTFLAMSGNMHALMPDGTDPVLQVGSQQPLHFHMEISESSKASVGAELLGYFECDDRQLYPDEFHLVSPAGILVLGTELYTYLPSQAGGWPGVFIESRTVTIPWEELDAFYDQCLGAAPVLPLELPPEYLGIPGEPQAIVMFDDSDRAKSNMMRVTLEFAYEEGRVAAGAASERVKSNDKWLIRDLDEEQRLLDEAGFVCGHLDGKGMGWCVTSRVPGAVQGLQVKGYRCEFRGAAVRSMSGFSASVDTGIDWLNLKLAGKFDDVEIEASDLLEAVQSGGAFVELPDGAFGLVPKDIDAGLESFEALGKRTEEGLQFRVNQAWILDALLDHQKHIDSKEGRKSLGKMLKKLGAPKVKAAPKSLKGELRPYQKEGVAWMQHLNKAGFGGCLADDMGLGKTVQVLAYLLSKRLAKRRPSLLVAPRSLIFNWTQEAKRFAPSLKLLDYSRSDREEQIDLIPKSDLVMTTYACMRTDAQTLAEIPFKNLILDESQAIKNANTQTAKAVRLVQASQVFALSGTPVENHIGELWSLFDVLNPGMLGQSAALIGGGTSKKATKRLPAEVVSEAVRPFVLRRTKGQVLKDLPERTEMVLKVELKGKQRESYTRLLKHYQAMLLKPKSKKDFNKERFRVLEALLRLRQAACHVGLIDEERRSEKSAKVELLMDRVTSLTEEGHKCLIFSQFTKFLDIVQDSFDSRKIRYERLDGKTRDRQAPVNRFQEDESIAAFLISLKAGGVGLNLTAADYVFILDPWWNPAAEAQAIDRAHRLGQERKVTAYRILAEDTIEDRIIELQEQKRSLVDQLFSEDNSVLRGLTVEDLRFLLQ